MKPENSSNLGHYPIYTDLTRIANFIAFHSISATRDNMQIVAISGQQSSSAKSFWGWYIVGMK